MRYESSSSGIDDDELMMMSALDLSPTMLQQHQHHQQQPIETDDAMQQPHHRPQHQQQPTTQQSLHLGQTHLRASVHRLEEKLQRLLHDFHRLQRLVTIRDPDRVQQLQQQLDAVQHELQLVRHEHDGRRLDWGEQQRQTAQLTECLARLHGIEADNRQLQMEQHERLQDQQRQLQLDCVERQQQQQFAEFQQQQQLQQEYFQYQQTEIGRLMELIQQHQNTDTNKKPMATTAPMMPAASSASSHHYSLADEQQQQQQDRQLGNPLAMIEQLVHQVEHIKQLHPEFCVRNLSVQQQQFYNILVSFGMCFI